MVSLAMEAPISLLSLLPHLTEFDFVLTHLCTEDRYLAHYLQMVKEGREVVLDNSVNELGEPVTLEEMEEVNLVLNPTYIIPPDHLNDLKATLGILDDAVNLWGKDKVWPVIQGTTYEEVVECGKVLKEDWGFNTVCIPYDITLAHRSKLPEYDPNRANLAELSRTRILAIKELSKAGITFNRYHLLGMNTLEEFAIYNDQTVWNGPNHWNGLSPEVSVDTGAPITNALNGRKFGIEPLVPKGVYFDYFTPAQILLNVKEDWLWNICMLKGSLSHGRS